jgi:capsular exopolysaccharide synthesis family protein
MERIKLAIEKARSGEKASPGEVRSLNSVVAAVPEASKSVPHEVESPPAPNGETLPVDAVEVQYERTAVVKLDPVVLDRHRVISHQKEHPASWVFDVLRTQVLQKMDENGWRTLAITSPSVESGKTMVSINLAMSISQQTQRTALLVDFDLRRPSVARSLGLNRPVSLNEVLAGNAEVAEALVNPGIERFVVLPTNRPVTHASEVLSSSKVGNLVSDLRERYSDRIVIFDLPPVLAADDVMAILPRIDCVLLVVGSGASNQREIEEAMNRLSRANLLGVVLNKDDAPSQNSYY